MKGGHGQHVRGHEDGWGDEDADFELQTEEDSVAVLTRREALKVMGVVAAAAAATPTALAGTQAQTVKRGGTLVFAVDGLTGNLDPGIYTTRGGILGTNLCGKCLTFVDYKDYTGRRRPQPALAESWETSRNGRIYRFHLRRGVKFHDGNTLSAHDCVRSFQRLINDKDPSRPAGTYGIAEIGGANIKRVRAVGDLVFEVTLGVRDAILPVRFGRYNSTILSAAAIEKYGAKIGTRMITAGPFKVASYTPNQGMRFVAFDDYYEGRPLLDAVVLQVISDSATLTSALKTGSVGASIFVAKSDLKTFATSRKYVVEHPPPVLTVYLGMNLASPVLSDIRVRQAINYAIDRHAINQIALSGTASGTPAGLLPPPALGYDESFAGFSTQNLPKARSLLGQAGAVGTIRYTSSNIDFWPKIAQIVTQNLQDVGLAVQTQYVDSATDTALQFDPKGHDLFQTCRGGALADPESWLAFQESASGYWSSAFGVTGILPDASAKIDQLILAASQQTNVKKRQALYHQLQLLIFDRIAPYAILGYHSHGIVRSSKIHNLNANALNAWALYAQRVWVG